MDTVTVTVTFAFNYDTADLAEYWGAKPEDFEKVAVQDTLAMFAGVSSTPDEVRVTTT